MTLPADTRLNDTPALGPLTAADFDTYQSPETAMLIGRDTEFQDTMAMPRRQSAPMSFEPAWYRRGVATCGGVCHQGRNECPTPDACRLADDSDFGALEGLTRGSGWIALSWAVVAVVAVAAWEFWGMLP
jgi:hypothetical protein